MASPSWVVEIEAYINGDAAGVDGSSSGATAPPWGSKRHSIYRVPEYVKNARNPNAYRPQLVSLGPFHHGDPALARMEAHKRRAVAQVVRRSRTPLREFVAAVEEIEEQLQGAYENLDERWRRHGGAGTSFVELMLKDGCFLLEMARMFALDGRVDDYGPDDPVFSQHGYLYLFTDISSDVVLMENQLPLLLLRKLISVANSNDFHQDMINCFMYFACYFVTCPVVPVDDPLCLHPLHVLHKSAIGARRCRQGALATKSGTIPCAAELRQSGIHFRLSNSHGFAAAVSFQEGVLSIPKIFLCEYSERAFLNLVAFEWLHPGAGNEVMAFLYFMDILIDNGRDVALLRSKGIIDNYVGSDEQAASLMNSLLKQGGVMSEHSSLQDVIREINAHCAKPWNKWRASLMHTYFSSPWVIISLVAAVLLLAATLMQTVYTVVPFYRTKS